ncbi:MAG: hypothetical protein SGCHY_005233 [Lobulomycetales sp.]
MQVSSSAWLTFGYQVNDVNIIVPNLAGSFIGIFTLLVFVAFGISTPSASRGNEYIMAPLKTSSQKNID